MSTLKCLSLLIDHNLMHRKHHSGCFPPLNLGHYPLLTNFFGLKSLIHYRIKSKSITLNFLSSSHFTVHLPTKSGSLFQILPRLQTLSEEHNLTPIPASSNFSQIPLQSLFTGLFVSVIVPFGPLNIGTPQAWAICSEES